MKPDWLNIWVGGSTVLLVGSEIMATAAAGGWAIGGLAHLPATIAIAVDALLLLLALFATAWFARRVHEAEPFFVATNTYAAIDPAVPGDKRGD